jgi:hypothetical protein
LPRPDSGGDLGVDARQERGEMHRKRRADDKSHGGKAFLESEKLLDVQEQLKGELSSNTRTRLNREVREARTKLNELEALDRPMTLALAAYCGVIKRRSGENVEIGSYSEFLKWCRDERYKLGDVGRQRQLTVTEARLVSALDEMTRLDQRTIQYRFQHQYSAQGKRGRPKGK